jgi:hypothetical protein
LCLGAVHTRLIRGNGTSFAAVAGCGNGAGAAVVARAWHRLTTVSDCKGQGFVYLSLDEFVWATTHTHRNPLHHVQLLRNNPGVR